MIIIDSLQQVHKFSRPCVVALGTFDGLHRGHMDVIGAAKKLAEAEGSLLAVFTFSNHPLSVLAPEQEPPALLTPERRRELLAAAGTDVLLEIPFDKELLAMSPEDFLQRLLQLGVSVVAVGENFTYGCGGAGSSKTLAAAAAAYGFALLVRPLLRLGGMTVSSTAVRRLIAAGEMRQAAELLGYDYALEGVVAHGNERGRCLGFPTANIELAENKMAAPAGGVYAVRVRLADGRVYGGMANIGRNPTFGDVERLRLETHLFAYSGDLYGQRLSVAFAERVRGEIKFAGVEELCRQLEKDKAVCKKLLR